MGTGGRDVEELFVQNQEREQELRTLLKTRPSESRDVSAFSGGLHPEGDEDANEKSPRP